MSNYIDLLTINNQLSVKEVEIEELGGSIFIKELSGKESMSLQNSADKPEQAFHNIIFYGVCNQDGSRVFKTNEAVREFMSKISSKVLLKIINECNKINKIEEPEEEVKN